MTGGGPPTPPEPFPVEVIRSAKRVKTSSARLVDGVIQVRIPAFMSADEESDVVSKLAGRIESRQRCAAVSLEARARVLAARFGLPEPCSIQWSHRQKVRWGSCATHTGDIRISSKLVEVPPWVLDHVIVHELAHLVEPRHTPAFHALVNRNPKAERAEGYLIALSHLGHLGR